MTSQSPQALDDRDRRQLRRLAAAWFLLGLAFACCTCFSMPNLIVMGVVASQSARDTGANFFDYLHPATTAFLIGGTLAVTLALARTFFYACQSVSQRRNERFLRLLAWLALPLFPLGTVAGIATLLLLRRPSIQAAFAAPVSPALPPSAPPDASASSG